MRLELSDGDVVGAYRIEAVVGSGGMGCVYRARHALSERVVAVKLQRADQPQATRVRERMMREAAILAQLAHYGIPRFHELGVLDDGRAWIAMELVAGTSLSRQLARGALAPDEVAVVIASVAEVLHAAHEVGITHRDLKPDNILLTPHDPVFPLRVLDWGIAHRHDGPRFTNLDQAIGTPSYMSPEQASGGPTAGHCDVYGLGVLAYYLLCGHVPFSGSSPVDTLLAHVNRTLPPLAPRCPDAPCALVELVERMLAKSYDLRPSAAEVAAELAKLRADERAPEYCAYSIELAGEATTPLRTRHE